MRYDGLTDATINSCSSDANTTTAGGERQQNEPATYVAPNNPAHMTAGANDYCTVPTTADSWAGFYYSANCGTAWVNSLLPGYPTDTSAAGQASLLHGFVTSAGDPVQAWNTGGNVYYGGIAFNRGKPNNGSIWLARYEWPMAATAPRYEFTTWSRGACRVTGLSRTRSSSRSTAGSLARTSATCTCAGRASRDRATMASSLHARPTAGARSTSRRSPKACTAASSATSA